MSADGASIGPILNRVLSATGVDFFAYRESTLRRRIERRVAANHCASLEDYGKLLDADPGECEMLVRDLTIKYSEFFRDRDVFDLLGSHVLPQILATCRSERRHMRIWSAGCAGGEETYSLAAEVMCMSMFAPQKDEVRILGSDIDSYAVDAARRGAYTKALLPCVPCERAREWFIDDGRQVHAAPALKSAVEFVTHDLTSKSALEDIRAVNPDGFDLVLCRNVLIYLRHHAQIGVLELLYNMLRPGGFLVLGTKERVPTAMLERLQLIDMKTRAYRACQPAAGGRD